MKIIQTVGYENDALSEKAQWLAKELNFSVDKDASTCLFVGLDKVSLKLPHRSLLSADFKTSTWSKRKAAGKNQGLIRACKPAKGIRIIDATAGWGKDAAILASFGASVLMLERHPVMATLLADALQKRSDFDKNQLQLTLYEEDAYSFLHNLGPTDYPDIVYIDPMHPVRDKSALVKKEMQILQQMIGPDNDALELIKLAVLRVKKRVVVKWPQKTKPLLATNACIEGKTVRFDIYTPQ